MATILGTAADEIIIGTAENDLIDHGGGSDTIQGGAGLDTVIFYDVRSNYTLQTLGGVTRIRGALTAAPNYADKLVYTSSVETLSFNGATYSLETTFDNVIFNTLADETIAGTAGNDTISHGGGSDIIDGGAGTDTLLFFDFIENFTITTVSGITHIVGLPTASVEYAAKEVIVSNVENVLFLNDSISLEGSFIIFGTSGSDVLLGTSGNDLFYLLGGSDLIFGSGGVDTVAISDDSSNFTVLSLSGVTHVIGKSTAEPQFQNVEIVLTSVETLKFNDATIALPTTSSNVIIAGNGSVGNDIIDHLGVLSSVDGGDGTDTLLFFDLKENFIITTIAGVTRILGKATADSKYAFDDMIVTNVERFQFLNGIIIIGGDGLVQTQTPQLLFDSSLDPLLVGTSGDDIIDPLGGVDWIDGGDGVDKVLIFDSITNYTVRTLAGVTRLFGEITAAPDYQGFEVVLFNVESILFNDAELPLAPVTDNLIFGTPDSEQLFGTIGDDVIDHMGGGDFIDGSNGEDTVLFFDSMEHFTITTLGGVTRILGEASASAAYRGFEVILINVENYLFSDVTVTPTTSIITGTTDTDLLVGTIHNDIIDPMGGSDFIDGGGGTDTLLINDRLNSFEFWTLLGVTWMWGNNNTATEPYSEFISILQRIETVQFLDGTVTLATSDNEVIFGTTDEDTEIITGTAGDDIIDHLAGSDQINGGAGYDTVLFFGNRDEFVVTSLAGRFRVFGKELGGNIDFPYENTEAILDNVERILFLDGEVNSDDELPQIDIDIIGTTNTGSENIVGTQGNNVIDHLGGSDRINGGAGIDTLLFFDVITNFTVTTLAGVTRVLGKSSADTVYQNQEVILTNVESLLFADGSLSLDTGSDNVELGLSYGSGTSEIIFGTMGDDIIDHLGGADTIYGGDGNDTLLFFDSMEYYTVTVLEGRARVVGTEGADSPYRGVEVVLDHVELLRFLDGTIALDGSGGPFEDDRIVNATVSQTHNGGAGTDTVIYGSPRASYTLSQTLSGYTIRRGLVETDTLLSIERLEFADKNIAIDLDNGEAAANTVRMLGAAFGSASVNDEVFVGIGLYLFDNGWTMNQVADLIVELDGFRGLGNRAFAQTVSNNIGFGATSADLDFFEQMLNVGVERGDLLRAAAEYYTNDQSINLAGLRQTGVEYVDWA